ncbi:hypothetical protein [Bradyrhizobium sp. WSM4349]|uniref:hypothetical protein n=1 Tax=Bradyrhizobium sp. WSM4349 TaxID=1040988 RepID=UPI0018E028D3|nr:hypothetical protein [Bradyrhizobium sp. WSM4349]
MAKRRRVQEEVGHLLSPVTLSGPSMSRSSFGRPRLTAVVPVTVGSAADRSSASQPLLDLTATQVRRAADGWRAVLRIGAVDHHVWSKEPPVLSAAHVVELPFDNDLEARAYAARRLWRAMNGRAPGPAFHKLSSRP